MSSYSFDSYRRELASDLTLEDLRAFTERFLARHRRQLQRKGPFFEFLVPDVLRSAGLPERYRNVTFDRELAIGRPDAEFLALGHPFVDAMLGYVGSYDFGGLTAVRHLREPKLAGRSGFLFAFVVRQRITREDGDECLFRFEPVFVTAAGQVDEEVVTAAVTGEAVAATPSAGRVPAPDGAFAVARQHLEERAGVWDWADDVEFLGLSWVLFG